MTPPRCPPVDLDYTPETEKRAPTGGPSLGDVIAMEAACFHFTETEVCGHRFFLEAIVGAFGYMTSARVVCPQCGNQNWDFVPDR